MEGCIACDLAEGRLPLPGGLIHETAHWLVEHCIGPLGVGTLIVKPRRHILHVADLSGGEAAELGPLLRRVTGVVTELVEPEQVYVTLWSHSHAVPGHIHFVVQPVTASCMTEHDGFYGPRLQVAMFERGDAPPPAEVEEFSKRARAALTASALRE